MNCSKCGIELLEDSLFCSSCGEKIEGTLASDLGTAIENIKEDKPLIVESSGGVEPIIEAEFSQEKSTAQAHSSTYNKIADEIQSCFSTVPILKALLQIDIFIMFGAIALRLFNQVVNIGDLVYSLTFYLVVLGGLLIYANKKDKLLAYGFLLYAFDYLISFIRCLIPANYSGGYFSFSLLFGMLIYGFIGILLYRRVQEQVPNIPAGK